jgi:DNA-binding transcriptional regulator YdaS (Cro superfamily)
MTLGKWLSRVNPPITQADLADKLGVDQTLVSKWLSGHRRPNVDNALAIERLTGGAVPVESWRKRAA